MVNLIWQCFLSQAPTYSAHWAVTLQMDRAFGSVSLLSEFFSLDSIFLSTWFSWHFQAEHIPHIHLGFGSLI